MTAGTVLARTAARGGWGSRSTGGALRYLTELGRWRDARKAELDAARPGRAELADRTRQVTADIALSMALWKSVVRPLRPAATVWDSGRVGPAERERLSTLIWGRLDAADPARARR